MKDLFINVSLIIVVLFFVSCATEAAIEEEVVQLVEVIPQVEPEPSVELIPEVEPEVDLEYSRSTSELTEEISYDTFQADKVEVLAVIDDLDEIMQSMDYSSWREFITPDSISYWNNKLHLQVLSTKLAAKDIIINDLGEYFVHMFIPARVGHIVNEIRYISPTEIKAVQVQGNKDIIYYQFLKIDGRWLVELPPL